MFEQLMNDLQRRMNPQQRGPDPAVLVLVAALATAVITFLVTWYLDPRLGRLRRAMTADRVAASARRLRRRSEHGVRSITASAEGLGHRVAHMRQPEEPPENDAVLAHKVESELFRDQTIDKGSININAESGVVVLRGTAASQEQVDEIAERVRRIDGVRDVRNLLHPAGTPAPVWQEAASASHASGSHGGSSEGQTMARAAGWP
jgi:hypothetical protein